MQKSKSAFTMIELVFAIVILGILAAVAIPKLAATRTDAQISKAISDISSIRSSIISERQSRLLTGDSAYITKLHNVDMFDGNGSSKLLMYGITAQDANGHWNTINDTTCKFKLQNVDVVFTYNNSDGTFDCNSSDTTYGEHCKCLTNRGCNI
ncbi:MAG: type II secretion system protein [Campylobacterota bacterium]|nr:type II secretion system protein [Campylobacterota bacterium]